MLLRMPTLLYGLLALLFVHSRYLNASFTIICTNYIWALGLVAAMYRLSCFFGRFGLRWKSRLISLPFNRHTSRWWMKAGLRMKKVLGVPKNCIMLKISLHWQFLELPNAKTCLLDVLMYRRKDYMSFKSVIFLDLL